ncbi:DUF6559 family protein [Phormidesmis sp. 146-33]
MSNLLQEALNGLAAIAIVAGSLAIVVVPIELVRRSDLKQKKRLAIRTYAKRLGRLLRARYGSQKSYTPAQVKSMTKEWGYSTRHDCYGLAMYCDAVSFVDYHRAIGESCNYELMRGEIRDCLFLADSAFDISDVIDAGTNFDQSGHHYPDHGGDGSGHPDHQSGDYSGHHDYDFGNHDGGA